MTRKSRSRSALAPGTAGFTVVLSMSMATTALSIDSVLPAFGDIRATFGLPADSTAVAGLVTTFIMGHGLGLLPAGVLADRYGRRPVLWGGLCLFIVAAVGAALAPSLEAMLIARFLWGLGSAGPRVASMAMVRDAYEGERMAKQMSAIMAVFILVPAVAPSLATVLLQFGPWPIVYWMCAGAAMLVMIGALRLPATLPADARTSIDRRALWRSLTTVVQTRGTVQYLVALTVTSGAFYSYLASTELILDETFGMRAWLPVVFGAFALTMGAAMWLNGRIVERVGLNRLIKVSFFGYLGCAALFVVVAFTTAGRPPFWAYAATMAPLLAFHGVLSPNVNAAAMRPLAHVAGVASAVLGMIPSVFGALIGSRIDAAFDGTIRPLAVGFFASAVIAAFTTPEVRAKSPAPATTSVTVRKLPG